MSAAILDRARAFEMIAPFLSDTMRDEIAEAIGEKLRAEVGGVKPKPTAAVLEPVEPLVDLSEHTETASFLVDHGYTGAGLVQATGRLTSFLTSHPNLTREAGMQVWLKQDKEQVS